MTVGRFAPSPSGRMHLGNVFAALLAWCSVRSENGTMLLRIEDLDPDRCKPEYAAQLKDDLLWLGLNWDEECPPQSTRTAAYAEVFDSLYRRGLVYPCYCSRNELHAASAPHASDGRPIYAGTCRDLTPEQRASQRRRPAWRIRVPDRSYTVHDRLRGSYTESLAADCGDFILRRSDGVFAYQLAVVVDDAQSGVNQVVRGSDLLSSTPRQLFLYEKLGYPPPCYCHVPLLLAADGRRLSKRDRDTDVGILRQTRSPESLIGTLGYWAGLLDRPEPLSAAELAASFSWDKVRTEDVTVF